MRNFSELKKLFPSTDKVGDVFVFDIGENKLRLIAAIHFNTGRVFIRAVLIKRIKRARLELFSATKSVNLFELG